MTTINAQINPSTKIVAKHITLHNVTATDVGLANVDNTSDLNKPVSTAQQSALDLKADQATTYTKVEVDSNIANLVDTAPATLDTLNELAAALGDDANFAATTASALGEKLAKASNLSDLADAATARTNLGLLSAATTESTDYATAAQGAKADTAEAFTSNVSAFGSNLVDDVNAAAARTTLELGNVTNESKATMFTNPSFTGDLTTFSGETKFDKKVKITPEKGLGLQLFSSGSNNSAVSLQVQGPTTVGHDLFQRSGFTNGFGDGSNHFHSLIDINRIEQEPDGDVQNIERVQERYYAIQDNLLPNNKAVFWAQHRVARPISTTVIDTSTATLDVSLLQNSSNRNANNQVFFVSNTTPLNKSEELTITLNGHTLSTGNSVRMTFSQAFVGPIVAAALFGKVTSTTTNTFNVELYGGNYKTTSEVADGNSQTALTFDEVVLETIGTNTIVQSGNETNLQLYSKTNFTPNRLKDETLKATWSVAHGLVKNEHCTLITDGRDDLVIKQAAYVLDPDPDSDGLSVILVYGRRIKQFDLGSFTAFGSTGWTLHKGSIDGIHDDTLGDNLINFNANNHGDYTAYQIGPGSQTDADCIAIGKNVYNKDASTIKIGYDNAMLDVRSNGIVVDGGITIDGNIAAKSTGTGAGGAVTGNDLTIEAGQVAGDGSTAGDLLLDGGRALAISGQTVTDGKVKIGSNHTTELEITPDTEISGDLTVSGNFTLATINDVADKISTNSSNISDLFDRDYILTGNVENLGIAVASNADGLTTKAPIASPTFTGVITTPALKFGASGKELKEYDYGTFAPKLALNGTTEQSAYAKQEGYYVKIGRLVTVNIIIKVTNFDTTFKTAAANSEIGITGLPHSAKIEGSDGPDTMIVQVHPRKGWQNLGDNSYSGSVGQAASGVIFFEKNVGQGEFGPAPGAGVGWNYERIQINDFHLHPFNFTADGVKAFTFQISGTYITDDDV